ncbi:MAG TPA: GAF domain-containing protein [Clostridia bacterium]|nr:GAF domain-containing protein [Clostridia bacterium]
MPVIPLIDSHDKVEIYDHIEEQLEKLVHEETDFVANLANFSSLLGLLLEDINWAGFYLLKEDELVLGPFYGKPAVSRIAIGDGVCGSAIKNETNHVVPKVCDFPGHITCDIVSQSEIVIRVFNEDNLLGVLDIDSPSLNRFDSVDEERLTRLLDILVNASVI